MLVARVLQSAINALLEGRHMEEGIKGLIHTQGFIFLCRVKGNQPGHETRIHMVLLLQSVYKFYLS